MNYTITQMNSTSQLFATTDQYTNGLASQSVIIGVWLVIFVIMLTRGKFEAALGGASFFSLIISTLLWAMGLAVWIYVIGSILMIFIALALAMTTKHY